MNAIIEHNVALMLSNEKGGMTRLLHGESIGGNASTFEGMSCAGANFYYEPLTGKILVFGNVQNIPSDIIQHNRDATFRVAFDIREGKNGIIEIYPRNISGTAGAVIDQSIRAYNKNRDFKKGLFAA